MIIQNAKELEVYQLAYALAGRSKTLFDVAADVRLKLIRKSLLSMSLLTSAATSLTGC